jgi:predicted RNA binding protein YcfA (HicA-like mRNA interferase family)
MARRRPRVRQVKFAELARFLGELGFTTQTIPGSHILFEHPEANLHIMLRLYQPDEVVQPAGLVYVRHSLDAWGLMERDEFDERIRNLALAR